MAPIPSPGPPLRRRAWVQQNVQDCSGGLDERERGAAAMPVSRGYPLRYVRVREPRVVLRVRPVREGTVKRGDGCFVRHTPGTHRPVRETEGDEVVCPHSDECVWRAEVELRVGGFRCSVAVREKFLDSIYIVGPVSSYQRLLVHLLE